MIQPEHTTVDVYNPKHSLIHRSRAFVNMLLIAALTGLLPLAACSGSGGGGAKKSRLTNELCVFHRFTQPCDYGKDGRLYKLAP